VSPSTDPERETAARSQRRASRTSAKKKHRRLQPQKPPPDFPAAPFPFLLGGDLTEAAQANPVVSIAIQYVGVPYRWGGESPKTGFDCSGLVRYVFAQLGVSLPHYAASQWYGPDAVPVPANRLEPGDLVFFTGSDGTRNAPGHVGIYVGDGYLIDAAHTGSFVRIDSLNEPKLANEYVGARQIVGQLLVARHLLDVDKPRASPTAFLPGFPPLLTIGPLREPLDVAAAVPAVVQPPARDHWVWAGLVTGGLLLLVFTRTLVARHRRQPPEIIPTTEASN
jgi:cell wall-associated NlpC family hydrolase